MADTVYYDEDTGQYLSEQEFAARQNEYEVVDQVYQEDQPFYVDLVSAGEEFVQDFLGGIGETAALGFDALGFEEEAELQRQGAEAFRSGAQKNKLERGDDANSFLLGTVPSAAAQIGTLIAAPYTLPLQAASTAGNKYRQVIDAGDTEGTALAAAGVAGVTDTAANLLALKYIPGATKGLKGIVQSGLIEGGEEAVTEAVDIGSDFVTAVPDPSLPEIGTRLAHAAGAGFIGGAGVQGVSNVVTSPQADVESDVEVSFEGVPEANVVSELSTVPPTDISEPNSPSFEESFVKAGDYNDTTTTNDTLQRFLDGEYSTQAVNVLQNAQDLAVNPELLTQTYQSIAPETKVKSPVEYLKSVKPEPTDVQTFIDTQPFVVDKADIDNHMYQIAKTATEVVVPEGRVSPIIDNDGTVKDFDSVDLEIDTTDNYRQVLIKDKLGAQLGAVGHKKDGSPVASSQEISGFSNKVINRSGSLLKEKFDTVIYRNVSQQEVKRWMRVEGYKGAAEALEAGQDVLNVQTAYATDIQDLASDFFSLSDASIDTVASTIISLRKRIKAGEIKNYDNLQQLLSNAQVSDKKTGGTRKLTDEEIKGAVALQESYNKSLQIVLDADRRTKEDSIRNTTDAAIKAAKTLVKTKKLSDNSYRFLVKSLKDLEIGQINKINFSLDKAYDKLRKVPYFPLKRIGNDIIGVVDKKKGLVHYEHVENYGLYGKATKAQLKQRLSKLDAKFEGEDVEIFIDRKKKDYSKNNAYYNVPTPILREMVAAEKAADGQVALDSWGRAVEETLLSSEDEAAKLADNVKKQLNSTLSEATQFFSEHLSVAANKDNLGFAAHFVEPDFTPGWSTDFRRVATKYILESAEYAATRPVRSKIKREAAKLPKGNVAKRLLQEYEDKAFSSKPQNFVANKAQTFTYYFWLGFNYIKSPVSNIVGASVMLPGMLDLQIRENNLNLSTINTARKGNVQAAKYLADTKSLKSSMLDESSSAYDPTGLKVLDALEKQGVINRKYYNTWVNEAHTATGRGNKIIETLKSTDLFFRASEAVVRSQVAFSSLEMTKGLPFEDRLRLAKDLDREVAGDFSKYNRPLTFHNDFLKFGLMFRNWQAQFLSNIARMMKAVPKDRGKSIGMYLGSTALITGWHQGLPFLDEIVGSLQHMFPTEYSELLEWMDDSYEDLFFYGAAASAIGEQMPSLASSGGGANLLPRGKNFAEKVGIGLLGAPGGILQKGYYGYEHWIMGNDYKAVETIAPQSISKIMKGARQAGMVSGQKAGLRDYKGAPFYREDGTEVYKPTPWETFVNMTGFNTVGQDKAIRRYYNGRTYAEALTDKRLNRKYAYAYASGDEKRIAELNKELEEHNRDLPPARQKKPNMSTIRKMVREMDEDKVLNLRGVRKDLKRFIYNQVTK